MDKKKAVQVQVGLSVKSTKETKTNQNTKPKAGAQELADQSARKVCLLMMLISGHTPRGFRISSPAAVAISRRNGRET